MTGGTHKRTHQKQDRVVKWHEDKHDALWFLANLRLSTEVDRELGALRFGPFLEIVEDVLDLLERDVEFEAKP